MFMQSEKLPPIPKDTLQAAHSLFGRGNIYLRIGENLDTLLSDLDDLQVEISGERSFANSYFFALISAFQFAEDMTDRRIFDAVRNRVDLKYALHLPLSLPRLNPSSLCEFRKQLFAGDCSRATYQLLVDRLAAFGLLKSCPDHPLQADYMLVEICQSNRLEMLIEAMYRALEALAISDANWLRSVILPHWYVSYSRSSRGNRLVDGIDNQLKWEERIKDISTDIQYLLHEINQSSSPHLASLSEVHELKTVLESQLTVHSRNSADILEQSRKLATCPSCIAGENQGGVNN